MIDHIKLLSTIIILVTGTGIAFYASQIYKIHRYPYLKSLVYYIIFFNLFVFVHLISKYFDVHLPENYFSIHYPNIIYLLIIFLACSSIGLVLSLYYVTTHLLSKNFKPQLNKRLILGLLLLIILILLDIAFFENNISIDGKSIIIFLSAAAFIFEIPILFGLLVYSKYLPKVEAKLSSSLALLLLSRYGILGLLALLPNPVGLFAGRISLLIFNFIPLIWIKGYFQKYAEHVLNETKDKSYLDNFCSKHDISKREKEIIKLILRGKNNRQIEEILFISYHTVKNHIYNIFQKTGVKNRYELIHAINKMKAE